jgi:methylase of polypeptide subunit release factors
MSKLNKEQLLETLGYSDSPNYRSTADQHHPLTAHLFRAARRAGAEGAYLFRTSPNDEILPPRPAVYVAEADTVEEAREIHRSLWNLGNAPFLIVLLPNEIRVYTGFDYDQRDQTKGLIDHIKDFINLDLGKRLADYSADSIDSGRLWANQADCLKPDNRLDTHLLRNLKKLEVVLNKNGLELETAHALIGKYVYIRYLWDRQILSEQWLAENKIDIDSVLGRKATLKGLRRLVESLDERFNGHIFPLPLRGPKAPTDDQVVLVASAFEGDDPVSGQMTAFGLYDFFYIPVETLSAIYEQFLHAQGKGKSSGAVYTPEYLADYLLAELNHVKPLEGGMKVLDPCCSSGIFLVLAYRRLIELELSKHPDQKLLPTELRAILTKSIFGIERNNEACLVAELSLILTMLHYISPPDLHRNKRFQFPVLHNRQIFEADFFDDSSEFWQRGERYDWVIGNPPWIEPESDDKEEFHALSWINNAENRRARPVAGNRVAEAFSWRATDLLNDGGHAGLVLHATSLFNHESKRYRQEFFKQHEVRRITNFTNLRYVMFYGRGKAPPVTVIYRKAQPNREKAAIIHYGPFVINQILSEAWKRNKRKEAWVLAINKNEISTIFASEAEMGEAVTWKLGLWGSNRDKRALQHLNRLFVTPLKEIRETKGWHLHEGVALRNRSAYEQQDEQEEYKIDHAPDLKGQQYFDAEEMVRSRRRFSIPASAFREITDDLCFVRLHSGQASLKEVGDAYLLFNVYYTVFSDRQFVLQSPDKRLSALLKDADELRALSIYFSSSLVRYFLFFHSPAWGIDRDRIYKKDIDQIPVPTLTSKQISDLAKLREELTAKETEIPSEVNDLQDMLDDRVDRILNIPRNISILARDFARLQFSLVHGQVTGQADRIPKENELLEYGQLLRDELDDFAKGRVRHKVSIHNSPYQEMIVCEVEATNAKQQSPVGFANTNGQMKTPLSQLKRKLNQQFSQWVYVQRGLRVFDGPKVYICKATRLIDWTKTQALNDADDLIAEVLSGNFGEREVAVNGWR